VASAREKWRRAMRDGARQHDPPRLILFAALPGLGKTGRDVSQTPRRRLQTQEFVGGRNCGKHCRAFWRGAGRRDQAWKPGPQHRTASCLILERFHESAHGRPKRRARRGALI